MIAAQKTTLARVKAVAMTVAIGFVLLAVAQSFMIDHTTTSFPRGSAVTSETVREFIYKATAESHLVIAFCSIAFLGVLIWLATIILDARSRRWNTYTRIGLAIIVVTFGLRILIAARSFRTTADEMKLGQTNGVVDRMNAMESTWRLIFVLGYGTALPFLVIGFVKRRRENKIDGQPAA